ncbi:hypothetical protein AAVH_14628 [Aphelenchoides avenae]|nr:hypothetical protein AAVH_14628 [Aphelenchus avenae]
MSTYVFVLAAEIPLFLLQVNVFIAAIKLARQNGRYRGFFILYSLQNFAEIVAYVSASLGVRFLVMGIIQPSDIDNTYGEINEKIMLFVLDIQHWLHLAVVAERYAAVTKHAMHKKLRQWAYLLFMVNASVLLSLTSLLLFVLDVMLVIRAGAHVRMVPRNQAMHMLYLGYTGASQTVCLALAVALEVRGFKTHMVPTSDSGKRHSRNDFNLLVFCATRTFTQAMPLLLFLISFVHDAVTQQSTFMDMQGSIYSYTYGIFLLTGALVIVVKSPAVRMEVFYFWCRQVGRVEVAPSSTDSRGTNSVQPQTVN